MRAGLFLEIRRVVRQGHLTNKRIAKIFKVSEVVVHQIDLGFL